MRGPTATTDAQPPICASSVPCTCAQAARFLTEATTALWAAADPASIVAALSRIVVPDLADWCLIEPAAPADTWNRIVLHRDPGKGRLAATLALGDGLGCPALAAPPCGPATLCEPRALAADLAQEGLIEALGGDSALCAPLAFRGQVLGALWLVRGLPRAAYAAADVPLVTDLALRAALCLAHARHLAAQREAARANEAFLSLAAHELRGPLTPLQLQIQVLLRRLSRQATDGEPARGVLALLDPLQLCERLVRRLARLIQSMLEVARLSSGRFELVREEMDLVPLAREVVARLSKEAIQAGSAIDLRVSGPCPGRWDRLRLELVLFHLLSNAIKHGRGRPIQVTATCQQGVHARLSVADQGEGIPPARLADLFTQGGTAPARQGGGLGVGLYLVDRIVGAMGGTVQVDSRPDVGTTFVVELPCTPQT